MRNLSYSFKYRLIYLFIATAIMSGCEKETGTEINNTPDDGVYFISNQEDFDNYSGIVFPEGSIILFATGKEFQGQFRLLGSGSVDKPNIVAAFNPETKEIITDWIDNKPIINGLGKVKAPIYLQNSSFWKICNLEITNTNGSNQDQGELFGILVVAENAGTVENISIVNNFIHNVNGRVGEKGRGGIHIFVKGTSVKTKFQNLLIENNNIVNVGGVGIETDSSWPDFPQSDFYPWTGVIIRENKIMRTGRNGIIIRYSKNALVEYNTLGYNGLYSKGHSLMNFNTQGCVFQYNEIYGNTSSDLLEGDRGAFIAGFSSTSTLFQYNYTHDNHWSVGFGRSRDNSDVTIRYNISQNELVGAYIYAHPNDRDLKGVKVYNNIHYFGKGKGTKVFVDAGEKIRIPNDTEFKNNIFYFEDTAKWVFNPDSTCVLENNLFYNLPAKGSNAIISNLCFIYPGSGGADIDMHNPERLAGYMSPQNSPGVNAGVDIYVNGKKDFWGNSLYKDLPDIGACEFW